MYELQVLNEDYFFKCLESSVTDDLEIKSKKLIDTIHNNAVKNIVDIIEKNRI